MELELELEPFKLLATEFAALDTVLAAVFAAVKTVFVIVLAALVTVLAAVLAAFITVLAVFANTLFLPFVLKKDAAGAGERTEFISTVETLFIPTEFWVDSVGFDLENSLHLHL